jgi:hypothetical protein
MKIELNPVKWFPSKAGAATAAPVASAVAVNENGTKYKAVESAMSTTAVVTPAAPKVSGFKSFMAHLLTFFQIGLKDVEVYTPKAAALAAMIYPEGAALEGAAAAAVETAAELASNTVQLVQQKYSDATPGAETNAQKLADAVTIAAPASIKLLGIAGINADTDRVTAAINAAVAILNTTPAPKA